MEKYTTAVPRKRIVNRLPPPAIPLLADAITRYLAQRDTSGVHPYTVRCERSQLKKLLELIGDRPSQGRARHEPV